MNDNICHEPQNNETLVSTMPDEQVIKRQDARALLVRPSLFWDINPAKLDMDRHAAFIIVRVMERGTRQEVRSIWNYYGETIIKKHLLEARYLHNKTISYFANQFDISRTQFKSFYNREKVRTWP